MDNIPEISQKLRAMDPNTSDETANKEYNVETVEKQERSVEEQLAEAKDNWVRAVAELENVRRRSTREKEEAIKYGGISLARDIVSVVDNLKRACVAPETVESIDAVVTLKQGIEMIVKDLNTIFARHHIKTIEALGTMFDPNYHQAMFEVDAENGIDGTVAQVVQDGYLLHDRLLRPALVGVSRSKKHVSQTA